MLLRCPAADPPPPGPSPPSPPPPSPSPSPPSPLLQWQQTKSHVKKIAACGDMHGNWGACSNANRECQSCFYFFFLCNSFFVTQKFIIILFIYLFYFPKWVCTKTPKFLFFLPLQFFFCSSGGFFKNIFFIFSF